MAQMTSATSYVGSPDPSSRNYESDNSVERHQQREEYDHHLIQSEEEYVKILCALVEGIYNPLKKYATRCKISKESVEQVFHSLEQMQQFHVPFLDGIREQDRVLDAFAPFYNFTSMYEEYFKNYSQILDIFASWQSMEFREFVTLRLKDTNVSKDLDPRLSSLPWYLYRPFDRIKEYYRYFKDLFQISRDDDTDIDDKKLTLVMKSVKKVYNLLKNS